MVPGHTESLPVTAINVPEADLNLYRVKDNKVAQFLMSTVITAPVILKSILNINTVPGLSPDQKKMPATGY